MFTLETPRLLIRPFTKDDLHAIHQILDVELQDIEMGNDGAATMESRSQWLQWTILGYEQYAQLHQPPYGERAVVLKQTAEVIGAIGFVPCLDRFEQMPSLGASADGGQPNSQRRTSVFSTQFLRPTRDWATQPKRQERWWNMLLANCN